MLIFIYVYVYVLSPSVVWPARQKYWCGLPFPSPGDLPNPGIKLGFCIAGGFFTIWARREAPYSFNKLQLSY